VKYFAARAYSNSDSIIMELHQGLHAPGFGNFSENND
jgi:hypothetical protein